MVVTTLCDKAAMAQRNLLIVWPGAFSTGWLGPTARIFDLSQGLANTGWRSTILAAPAGRLFAREAAAASAAFPGAIKRTPFSRFWYPSWLECRPVQMLYWAGLRSRILRADPERKWGRRAAKWYASAEGSLCPDAIWAVSDALLAGPVAGRALAERFGRPWVLELEDPWEPPGPPSQAEMACFSRCLASASAVVTTTQTLASEMAERYPVCQGKIHVEHLTFDAGAPRDGRRPTGAALELLHVGSIYGGRREAGRALVEGLARAAAKEPQCRASVHLRLLGGGPRARELKAHATRLGVGDAVSVLSQCPLADALRAMDQADVLVAVKFADALHNAQIPGKVFQYLGRGKPILGIMGECEAAEIILRSGLGVVVDPHDVEGIASAIAAYWRNRRALRALYAPDWDYVQRFSRGHMAERLNALLTGLVTRIEDERTAQRASCMVNEDG